MTPLSYKIRRARIRRVDIVDEGAAPDAHILIAKRRDPDPNSVEAIRERVREFLDRTAASVPLDDLATATKAEIEEAVDEVARDEWLAGDYETIEEAPVAVWTEEPDLYRRYSELVRGGERREEVAKSGERKVRDHLYESVIAKADLMRLREFSTPVEELVDRVWDSPEGRDLYRVYADPRLGVMPVAKARNMIAKSDGDRALHAAIRQADSWLR